MNLPAARPSQYALETAASNVDKIRLLVRFNSPVLTAACVQHGLSSDLAELCGGLLASVIDDLIAVGRLARADFERTKRKQRVLAAAAEPAASALRIAIAASPVNGRAAVEHWDVVCEQHEVGKLAWLLGMSTELAHRYAKKVEKRG